MQLRRVESFTINVNGQTHFAGDQGRTRTYLGDPKYFIDRTSENRIRIEISYEPPSLVGATEANSFKDLESEDSISRDSLDDVVIGSQIFRESAIDCPEALIPVAKTYTGTGYVSPFKRRLNAAPVRHPRKIEVSLLHPPIVLSSNKNKTKKNSFSLLDDPALPTMYNPAPSTAIPYSIGAATIVP